MLPPKKRLLDQVRDRLRLKNYAYKCHKFWQNDVVGVLEDGKHRVFRSEMEHLFRRVGFSIEAVYGDFFKNELRDESRDMIWLAICRNEFMEVLGLI